MASFKSSFQIEHFYTHSARAQMNSTHRSTHWHFNKSVREIGAKLKPHGSVCPPFLDNHGRVVWRPVVSILMTSPFSDSIVFSVTLENSVFKKHRFQIAPLWRAFSNGSVFDDRFRRCSLDDSRIRSKTAPFSFENGLVWTGPYFKITILKLLSHHQLKV